MRIFMQNVMYDCLATQYSVYMIAEIQFLFEFMGICDMMKMVYCMDMPFQHFGRNGGNLI